MGARKQGKRILEPNVGTNKTKNRGAGGENDSKWWDRIGYGVYIYIDVYLDRKVLDMDPWIPVFCSYPFLRGCLPKKKEHTFDKT